jgi:hypothetical protein
LTQAELCEAADSFYFRGTAVLDQTARLYVSYATYVSYITYVSHSESPSSSTS